MAIFAKKRERAPKSTWFMQFAQCIDEDDGLVYVDVVAEYMNKPVGTIKQKVEALAKEFGEDTFYRMVTAASHQYYNGRTCNGFDEHSKERKRKSRNKRDDDLLQLQFLADHLDETEPAETKETAEV